MCRTSAELRRKGFEPVHVEIERYNGPKMGIADVNGVPPYFHWHDIDDETFLVWRVDEETLALEWEQWRIHVAAWHRWSAFDAIGLTNQERHDGMAARLDELTALLGPRRVAPEGARLLKAEWSFADDLGERYHDGGTDFLVRWGER